ncbi:YbfB/YjiJ family MFS transporter [Alkalicoccus luteus]|uniref:YbfB/YjiJ family MFS transporter n=1 Tax=Alkalicoccus luteus TaxID=1237094 RepID=UPI0040341D2D
MTRIYIAAAAAGFLALAALMGIGRFAYTPILPLMETDRVGELEAGWLASANYIGYFLGAFAGGSLMAGRLRWIAVVVLTGLTVLLMGLTESSVIWSLLRFAAGFLGGVGFVWTAGLILPILQRAKAAPYWIGLLYGGVGFGIFLSGYAVPRFAGAEEAWEAAWIGMGLLVCIAAAVILLLYPKQTEAKSHTVSVQPAPGGDRRRERTLFTAYFLEGFGYIIFATFIVSILAGTGGLDTDPAVIWMFVGIGAVPSCLFWAWVGARVTKQSALIWAYAAQTIGVLIPALTGNLSLLLVSAVLFGGTFMGITMMTISLAHEEFPGKRQKATGNLTALYGIGQVLGPLAASALLLYAAEALVFVTASGILAAAGLLMIAFRRQNRST